MILAFDTSGSVGSVAIAHEGRVLAREDMSEQAGHASDLLPTITAVLDEAGVSREQLTDLVVGEGQEAKDYNKVVVNYTGTLEDGSIFDSSLNPGREPFTFTLGVGSVIKGWDLGVKDMKVGGKRKLTIPPELGYGDKGAGNVIPPGATLIFEVELLEVEAY